MRQQPITAMLRGLLPRLWQRIALLCSVWHRCRCRMGNIVRRTDILLVPLAERPLLCLSAGLLSGHIPGTWLRLTPVLIGGMLLAGVFVSVSWSSSSVQRCCRLFFAGLLLTHLHVWWQARALPENHIARVLAAHAPRRVAIEGTLYRALEPRGDRQRLYLRLHRLRQQQRWQTVSGRIRLNVHTTDLPFLPGDVIHIEHLRLYPARGFLNPGGFNFQRVMQRQGIYALGGVSNPARLSLRRRPDHVIPARMVERWRRLLRARVRTHLAPPHAGMFLAMVLGDRGALTPALRQHFRAAGVAHLLVVSGLHVGFIAASVLFTWKFILRAVRSWLPRACIPNWRPTPLAVMLSLPVIVLYCSLVGWKIPTTRAALMVGSAMLALALNRPHDLPYALVLAGALILLFDPTAIVAVGFQLSFVAVVAMLLVSRTILAPREAVSGHRWGRRLWAYALISSAAYFGTLPILAGAFHTLPTFGILANAVLVPLAGLVVPAGVAVLAILAVWPALGPFVCLPFAHLLPWIGTLAETLGTLPRAQIHLAAPSAPMILGYYGLLGGVFLPACKRWRLPLISACTAVLLIGLMWQYVQTRTRELQVTFLDVGSGDAIFIQTPGNHYLLIDGGGTYNGRFDIGTQVIAPFLWNRYVDRFALMAMTHPQVNHARGLVSLLRLFPTTHLLTNGTPLTADYLRDLLKAGQHWGTRQHTALDGPRQWQWDGVQLTVLSPPSLAQQRRTAWAPPTENDRSLVLRLQYGSVRILLTGDIQHATERWLLTQGADLRADILQVPHHGSKTSTSPAFVREVRPQVGIISPGAGNPYGHPHPQTLQVLESQQVRIFRTDRHGAVTITTDGTRYHIKPFRTD